MKKILIKGIIIIITCCSCTDNVVFKDPQPSFKNELKRIPWRFRGTWVRGKTPAYKIYITKDSIIEQLEVDLNLPYPLPPEFKNLKIDGDSLIIKDLGLKIDAKISGNNVKAKAKETIPLFSFDKKKVIKRYKNYLFINIPHDDKWKIKVFYKKNSKLYFVRTFNKEKIDKIMHVTDVEIIESENGNRNYLLNPTKKEVRNLLKLELIKNSTEFNKE